jgi:NADPH:quinone reductase-like Zn-dependent oxidoreductase
MCTPACRKQIEACNRSAHRIRKESDNDAGSWAEYAKCTDKYVAIMPSGMSFPDAAALPLVAMTALQALRKYNGSLAGKTVLVPAGRQCYSKQFQRILR